MSLKSRFAPQFNPKIRDRGLAYFRGGAVKILEHSDSYVLAQVEGTLDYFVELSLGYNSLDVACTCPYSSTHRRRARRDCSLLRLLSVNATGKVNGAKSKRRAFSKIRLVNSAIQMIEKSFRCFRAVERLTGPVIVMTVLIFPIHSSSQIRFTLYY